MNIIQTLWSRNSPDFISEKCGWLSPEYNLMSWALSCLQLKKFYPSVILYADKVSANLLCDILHLPYTKVICNLDKMNDYDPQLWALPKIHTYSIQKDPFLHVDGDVFIWKAFDEDLINKGLIAQNKESATGYYENIMLLLEAELKYFPQEILDERNKQSLIFAYNAGIFGGSDIQFFRKYTQKAFDFVNLNFSRLDKINLVDFNIFFEQYLFYCLAKKSMKKVSTLFPELIGDNQYSGFGDFIDVPYNRTFLHTLGNYKKNISICIQLANRLREDYPEHYYRIIKLCKDKEIPLIKDYYFAISNPSVELLMTRYSILNNLEDTGLLKSNNQSKRIRRCMNHFIKKNNLSEDQKKDFNKFKRQLKLILNSKFSLISDNFLYARDLKNIKSFEYIFGEKKYLLERRIVIDPNVVIIESAYKWIVTDQILLEDDLELNVVLTVVIPECDNIGYSLKYIDELDFLILSNLEYDISIRELMENLKYAFDEEDLAVSEREFQILILGRIKKALELKIIDFKMDKK